MFRAFEVGEALFELPDMLLALGLLAAEGAQIAALLLLDNPLVRQLLFEDRPLLSKAGFRRLRAQHACDDREAAIPGQTAKSLHCIFRVEHLEADAFELGQLLDRLLPTVFPGAELHIGTEDRSLLLQLALSAFERLSFQENLAKFLKVTPQHLFREGARPSDRQERALTGMPSGAKEVVVFLNLLSELLSFLQSMADKLLLLPNAPSPFEEFLALRGIGFMEEREQGSLEFLF
ncbi:MAG TPA: hypothetical protein VKM72_23630 [Thermoanaerobaculia bacterium]|nr:hypothetical protein [Thermoanaerobaculia bacterium]